MTICEESKIPAEAEVFGLFRHLIPAAVTAEGGEFQEERARNELCPDLKLKCLRRRECVTNLTKLK